MERADWILRSRSIFTGITPQDVRDGFVAVRGDKIVGVGDGDEYGELLGENTLVTDVGSRTVSCALMSATQPSTRWRTKASAASSGT